jgi:uncharacterized membrane protein HdeD (DUF308 family)
MIYDMMAGATVMASIAIALFFLRFWRDSGDRFFLYFALSFLIEGVHRLITTITLATHEDSALHYLVRLLAYGLILWAILEKNWPRSKKNQPDD